MNLSFMQNRHFPSEVPGADRWTGRPWHRLLWSLAAPHWDTGIDDWRLRLVTARLSEVVASPLREKLLQNLVAVTGKPVGAPGAYAPGMPVVVLSRFTEPSCTGGEVYQVGDWESGWRALAASCKGPFIRLASLILGNDPDGERVRLATEAEFTAWLDALPSEDAAVRVRRLAVTLAKLGATWDYDPLDEPDQPPPPVAVPDFPVEPPVGEGDEGERDADNKTEGAVF